MSMIVLRCGASYSHPTSARRGVAAGSNRLQSAVVSAAAGRAISRRRPPSAAGGAMQRVDPAGPDRRYAWYVAGVFTLANTLSFVDRQLFALLLDPIERELRVDDVRVSLLHGLAFVLMYAAVTIPVARLADARSRRNVVAGAVLLWSAMAALCAS